MNHLLLTFTNEKLEQDYQTYVAQKLRIWILGCSKQFYLPIITSASVSIFYESYIASAICIATMIGCIAFQCYESRVSTKYLILGYQAFIILVPELVYITAYTYNYDQTKCVNYIIILIIFPLIFICTTNLISAILQIAHYFGVALMRLSNSSNFRGLRILNEYLDLVIIYVHLDLKEFFFNSHKLTNHYVNFYLIKIDELIQKTSQHLMLFKFDTNQQKFELILSNYTDNLNLKEFLSNKRFEDQSLSDYLYQNYIKISNNDFQDEIISVIDKFTSERLSIHIYVQSYPKLTFFIKILDNKKFNYLPLIEENRIITQYLQKLISQFHKLKRYQVIQQCQVILNELIVKVGILKISSCLNKYVLKNEWINVNDLIHKIASMIRIDLNIDDNENRSIQIKTDRLLLQNLILGLFIVIKRSNSLVVCVLNDSFHEVNIRFIISNKLARLSVEKRWFSQLNNILLRLSFEKMIIKQNLISFSITKADFQRFL